MQKCRAFFFFSILGFLPICSGLFAATLDESIVQNLRGKKIGYYTGSFDPIHLGYQHVIDTCLKEEHVDYVLIYTARVSRIGFFCIGIPHFKFPKSLPVPNSARF